MTPRRPPTQDRGETLIELLFAVVLMASVGIVFLSGLAGAALSSHLQATGANADTIGASVGETATAMSFAPCATPADYTSALTATMPSLPAGYSVSVTGIEQWDGTAYTAATTTLATAIDDAQTTITLTSTDGLPGVGPYELDVTGPPDEVMTVTAGFGTTALTVTRAIAASPFAAGATVQACSGLQRIDIRVTTPDGRDRTVVVAKRASQPLSPAAGG
jgi:Tfp pilus assembly protein PilV